MSRASLVIPFAVIGAIVATAAGNGGAAPATPEAVPARGGLAVSRAGSRQVQRQPRPHSCHARGRSPFSLPDRHCTPGAIDPAVSQADIGRTICRAGYTDAVRPPESITEAEKRASMRAYGDSAPLRRYEYDHLVPLELGGAPNDARNLWPEPGTIPNPKDALENHLRARVCAGTLRLAAAQLAIAHDWVRAWRRSRPVG